MMDLRGVISRHRKPLLAAVAVLVWLLAWLDAWAFFLAPHWLLIGIFALGVTAAAIAIHCARGLATCRKRAVWSLAVLPIWQFLVYLTHILGADGWSQRLQWTGTTIVFFTGLAWVVWWVDRSSKRHLKSGRAGTTSPTQPREWEKAGTVSPSRPREWEENEKPMPGPSDTTSTQPFTSHSPDRPEVGPCHSASSAPTRSNKSWNPLNLSAWYYKGRSPKLRQSLATILSYAFCFCLCFLIISQFRGCSIYESPAGGGEVAQITQVVKLQKVESRKYVINPFSSVIFNPPPINEVKLQLLEITEHLYKVGSGKGEGAGFSKGTARGKVRFLRLKYDGGDWDQDMARGSDLNLLTEYGVRTGHPVSDRPEPIEISQLKNFPARKSPPLVYMTGQRGINVSPTEIKILRHYLTEQHGMLFGDNGGSPGWGNDFITMMNKVLPRIEPIALYLDHPIHRAPYPLPKLPYVARHGRSDALGWVVDGRLAAYYHPGDIGDAWADGHSGVPREIWEACYQLGVNVIFYAHVEYDRWLNANKQDDE
jgi:hypothetical protein